jgi:hypothetical protein
VTPQLAVVAYLRDPSFSDNARARIKARCPVNDSRLTEMSALERHLVAGPPGPHRSAKAAASLVYLLGLLPEHCEWLTTELASPELTAFLAEDVDQAGKLAEGWLDSLKAVFKMLDIKIA